MGNLFLTMEIDYGMSSFIAKNKLPTLKPNSYLHTQISEIRVTTKWSKQLYTFFFAVCQLTHESHCIIIRDKRSTGCSGLGGIKEIFPLYLSTPPENYILGWSLVLSKTVRLKHGISAVPLYPSDSEGKNLRVLLVES